MTAMAANWYLRTSDEKEEGAHVSRLELLNGNTWRA